MISIRTRLFLLVVAPILAAAHVRDGASLSNTNENPDSIERELGYQHSYKPWTYQGYTRQHRPYGRQYGNHYYRKPPAYRPAHHYHPSYNVPCDNNLTPFETEVFVDFNGDPSQVTFKDVEFLEKGFRRTYNVLSKRLCDDKFREIHSVKAIRDYGDSPVIPRGGLSWGLRYVVKGVCQGCSYGGPLFAPPIGYHHRALSSNETEAIPAVRDINDDEEQHVRQLWQPQIQWQEPHFVPVQKKSYKPNYYGERIHQTRHEYYSTYYASKGSKSKSSKSKSSKGSKSKGYYYHSKGSKSYDHGYGGKICTCNSKNPLWRPPTEAGFGKAFNKYILQFATDEGVIINDPIQIVKDVTEITGKPCTKKPSKFEAFVEIEFTGDLNALTSSEIDTLEFNVLDVYNGLSDKQCDRLFRDVEKVTVISQESANLVFTLVFLLEAECRGCNPNDTTIFGNGQNYHERQLWSWSTYYRHSRYQKHYGEECFCPLYSYGKSGAPTERAFEDAYRMAVEQLFAFGDLVNVDSVVEVAEIGDGTIAPTVAPEPTPAVPIPQPTDPIPTDVPIPQPTDPIPTDSPSTRPTDPIPTDSPSARPTDSSDGGIAAPTTSPSYGPSASPSQSPSTSPSTSPSQTPSSSPSTLPSTSPSLEPTSSTSPPPSRTSGGIPAPSSEGPSTSPSSQPSSTPSASPSSTPSASPSSTPISQPSLTPSASPTVSQMPSSIAPSSTSMEPSVSLTPSTSQAPSVSLEPSISTEPSTTPSTSNAPSESFEPSVSTFPSEPPSTSQMPSTSESPSTSMLPSEMPSSSSEPSVTPSVSLQPSESSEPSLMPSVTSQEPSTSTEPTLASQEPSSTPSLSTEPSVSPSKPPSSQGDIATCPQEECFVQFALNLDPVRRRGFLAAFPLESVSFVRNVTIDIAATHGHDLEIRVIAPNNEMYILMLDTVAIEGTGDSSDFDLGINPNNGTLENVDAYTFVESGGTDVFTSPFSPAGTYNALTWGSPDGPYNAGDWSVYVRDSVRASPSSVGQVVIRYCGVCLSDAPSSSPSTTPSTQPTVTQDGNVPVTDVTTTGGGGRRRKKQGRRERYLRASFRETAAEKLQIQ